MYNYTSETCTMEIREILDTERIFLDIPLPDKDAVLRFAAEAFAVSGIVADADTLYDGMLEREETMSTGIGKGLAIPHSSSPDTKDPAIVVIRLAEPIDYDAIDGVQVKIVVALVAPEHDPDLHLRMLADLARLCQHPDFMKAAQTARDQESLLDDIRRIEKQIVVL